MIVIVINILAFAAVFLAVLAANAVLTDLRFSERRRVRQRMEERFRDRHRQLARSKSKQLDNFSQIASEARAENASGRTLKQRLEDLIDQSGVETTLRTVFLSGVGCAVVFGLLGALLAGPALSPVFSIGAFSLPILYLSFKRRKRLNRLRAQLPDAFDLMARVLRAGQTVSQAMQSVADEFDRPISLEFLYCSEQMNLGLSAEQALRELAKRTGLLEIKIFVLSVVVHRQTGGNLAVLLDKLAHVVRERFRIRGMIDSLTAQGRFQAGILLSLPPAMFVLLLILHYEYEMILLDYPLMIVFALGMMGAGALWIRRIVNFDY